MPANAASESARIRRERRTIGMMIGMYCRARHGARRDTRCEHCDQLYRYAMERIDKCVFSPEKPTCANCPVHCYRKAMREEVRSVMRYAGPRMLLRHPVLAVFHRLDGRRVVELPRRGSRSA
ncbi:MAG: nitrous oxide-stimulated promoter family protein [Phycisphaerales bacterium]|nr:nitrous oxide-stimulated promoter family protein [Phycisphaerales bacterium]